MGEDLALIVEEDEHAHGGVVGDVGDAVGVRPVHVADAVGIHDTDLPVHLEDASNALARPVLEREVGGGDLAMWW